MLTPTDLADVIAEQEAAFVKRQPKSAALADRAAGKVYDVDGNEYVDLHGGYGAALAGHAHPAIVRAVKPR